MIRSSQKIKMLKISEIFPNPYQLRRNFNSYSLHKLSESIKEVGIISPITVRPSKKGYELICGQRRLRAAELSGMEMIPAIIINAGDRQCAQISMIENIHRENISYFEEAEGFYNLISYHKIKRDSISSKLCVDESEINEKMSLLSIPSDIKYKIEENNIGKREAKEILKLRNEEIQKDIIEKVIKDELGLREIRSLVKETLKEMVQKEKEDKRGKIRIFNMPLYVNTVKKTAELLKKNGASVSMEQTENENCIEFSIKIQK